LNPFSPFNEKPKPRPKSPPPPKITTPPLPPYYFNPYNPSPPPPKPTKANPHPKHKPPKPLPYIIPPAPKKPKSRPYFTPPLPTYVYPIPHRRPPFPAPKPFIPSIYKGVPNQPLGVIPPHAIPFWKPQPKAVVFMPRKKPPKPDHMGKWVPYFHYPIPFRDKRNKKPVYVPQFVYVPKNWKPVKGKKPDFVPVRIVPPLGKKKGHKPEGLVDYKMPVLLKPVDPKLRNKMKHYKKKKQVRKERKRRNKKMKKDKKYRPKRPCNQNDIFCRRVELRNLKANKDKHLRKVKAICKNSAKPSLCNMESKNRLFRKHPEYAAEYPEIPLYNPLKSRFMGFKEKCKEWYIGVIVNRHFIHKHQWHIKDYSYDKHGNVRFCKGWMTVPVLRKIQYKTGVNGGNPFDNMNTEVLQKLSRKDVEEICLKNLGVVLNVRRRRDKEWHRDKLMKECLLKYGDGEVKNIGAVTTSMAQVSEEVVGEEGVAV
jgi:hypothetical protein